MQTFHGQARPTSYQRKCFAELRRDGHTLSNFRYWNADDDFSISALARKGDYANRVAFPRTKAIADHYERQTYGPRDGETVDDDGTVRDELGNALGIDQPAAARRVAAQRER